MPGRKRGRKAAAAAPAVGVITGPALAEAVPDAGHPDRSTSPGDSRAHKKHRSASPGASRGASMSLRRNLDAKSYDRSSPSEARPLLEGFRSITARRTASPPRNAASEGVKGDRHRSASPVLGPMISGRRPRLLASRKPFTRYSPPGERKTAPHSSGNRVPEPSRGNKSSEQATTSSRRVTRRIANARSP